MNNITKSLSKRDSLKSVFRGSKKRKLKSTLRLSIESILMLFVGSYLIVFLNWLPKRLDWSKIAVESWSNLIKGFSLIIEAFISFGAVFLVFILIIISLTLLLGFASRIIRILGRVISTSKKRSKQLYLRRNR